MGAGELTDSEGAERKGSGPYVIGTMKSRPFGASFGRRKRISTVIWVIGLSERLRTRNVNPSNQSSLALIFLSDSMIPRFDLTRVISTGGLKSFAFSRILSSSCFPLLEEVKPANPKIKIEPPT